MSKAVFVMGASGRVGGSTVAHLRGKRPIIAASSTSLPSAQDVTSVPFDLTDPSTFDAALKHVDTVFLMRPPQIADAKAFSPFLERARRDSIRRIIVLSVLGAESNPILPHHGVEKLVMEMGFDWTMVRPSDFMQNMETVHLTGIVERDEIAVPAGSGKSSFIDVNDIGEAIARIIVTEGHVGMGYALTGPEPLDFAQVADALTKELGRTIRYRRIGALRFIIEKLRSSAPLGLTLVMTALYTVQRLGRAATVTDQLQALIQRSPARLEDYLRANRDVFTQH